eukprot:GEZU01033139.1.p1 GENE.GEZU01033139.1~~GEZU01033139.1.p1  ORF type:complete len:301 (+),score=71.85 GEZU01033139.1:103-1005(+)
MGSKIKLAVQIAKSNAATITQIGKECTKAVQSVSASARANSSAPNPHLLVLHKQPQRHPTQAQAFSTTARLAFRSLNSIVRQQQQGTGRSQNDQQEYAKGFQPGIDLRVSDKLKYSSQTGAPENSEPNIRFDDEEEADMKMDQMFTFRDAEVGNLIADKAPEHQGALTIDENITVFDAVKMMSEKKIGAVVVTPSNNPKKVSGMFTERDYLNKVILKGLSSKTTIVKDIMSKNITTVTTDTSAGECMNIMTTRRFRHLPVIDKETGELVGLISIGDIVKYILTEQRKTIEFLEDYVQRTY